MTPASREDLVAIAAGALGPLAESVRLELDGKHFPPAELLADLTMRIAKADPDVDASEVCRWYALDLADDLPKGFPAWRGYGIERTAPL